MKELKVKLKLTADDDRMYQTKYVNQNLVIRSFDTSNKLFFNLENVNMQEVTEALLVLVVYQDQEYKKYIKTISPSDGTPSYVFDDLLGYEGNVYASLNIEYASGGNDVGYFKFRMEKSDVDSDSIELADFYVDKFEDVEKLLSLKSAEIQTKMEEDGRRVAEAAASKISEISKADYELDKLLEEIIAEINGDRAIVLETKNSALGAMNDAVNAVNSTSETAQEQILLRPTELDDDIASARTSIQNQPEELDGGVQVSKQTMAAKTDEVVAVGDQQVSEIKKELPKVQSVANTEITAIKKIKPTVEAEVTGLKAQMADIEAGMQQLILEGAMSKEDMLDELIKWNCGQPITRTLTTDFVGKEQGSLVENPNFLLTTTYGSLRPPVAAYSEFSTNNYAKVTELDNNWLTTNTVVSPNMRQVFICYNIVEDIERKYPGLFAVMGAMTLAEKAAIARNIVTMLRSSVWGYGTSPSGNLLTHKLWYTGTNPVWESGSVTNSTGVIKELARLTNDPAAIKNRISDEGLVCGVAYAEAADGVTASVVNIDKANLTYEITLRKTGLSITKAEYNDLAARVTALGG